MQLAMHVSSNGQNSKKEGMDIAVTESRKKRLWRKDKEVMAHLQRVA